MKPVTPAVLLSIALSLSLLACASEPSEAAADTPTSSDAPAPTAAATTPTSAAAPDPLLDAAVAGTWRSPANVARDQYRHPRETLSFFGVQPTHTVVEITPGGGWYAEILAPYLRDAGTYIAAVVDPSKVDEKSRDYQTKARDRIRAKLGGAPTEVYGRGTIVEYDPKAPVFGAPASADVVLTFRNVHNWRSEGQAEGMFKGFFDVLKPGGTLGVVEHRAKNDVPADDESGYVGERQVIALAEAAGFKLDAKSEVNANPKDTKDHPNGVWTLPPSKRHDPEDAQKYLEIGESDRMTLRFVKP
jgi:predicted methyltransferase